MKKTKKMRLQQSDFSRFFVTIPLKFIKELKWEKGKELNVKLEDDKIIIYN